jgi:hypothetical protein
VQHNRRSAVWLAIGTFALLTQLVAGNVVAANNDCNRACMRSVLDQYLDAVFQHTPNTAPLSAKARATENAAPLENGAGIWRTANGYGQLERRYFDTTTSQAGFFGVIKEGSEQSIVSLRVKIEQRKITEAEWTVARKVAGGLFSVEGLLATPPPADVPLPSSERTPRVQMIAAADAYFEALQIHDGARVPHVVGCERIENGVQVTHRQMPPPGPAAGANPSTPPALGIAAPGAAQEHLSGDCAAGLEMFKNSIADTSHRRFAVVDEEAGVVMGSTLFHRPPGSTMKRNLLTEFFYVKSGQIAAIYAAMYYLDHSAPDTPGW